MTYYQTILDINERVRLAQLELLIPSRGYPTDLSKAVLAISQAQMLFLDKSAFFLADTVSLEHTAALNKIVDDHDYDL